MINFIYSENAIKFCKILTVDLTGTTEIKFMVEILLNFVAFSLLRIYELYFGRGFSSQPPIKSGTYSKVRPQM